MLVVFTRGTGANLIHVTRLLTVRRQRRWLHIWTTQPSDRKNPSQKSVAGRPRYKCLAKHPRCAAERMPGRPPPGGKASIMEWKDKQTAAVQACEDKLGHCSRAAFVCWTLCDVPARTPPPPEQSLGLARRWRRHRRRAAPRFVV